MAADEKWYFTKEQLLQSPSRKSGIDVDKELSSRQQAANFIQDMGQRLQVSQLCINTAIVYMHRFYVFHSLASFHRNAIAAAALFLAAKVEEQPRKLEHVIKVAHICLHRENPNLDTKSEVYLEQAQDLVFNENVLLQTLGFDVAIDHPHTHVVRCCHLVRASKDLAQTSYFMASNSLHLTTMCLQYKPTVVACFCIHLACKWSNWEIPRSNEGKDWFWYVDKTVTLELLEQLTGEFLAIFDKCPTKLKRKMMSMNQNNSSAFQQPSIPHDGLQFVSNFEEPRKLSGAEASKPPEGLFPVQKQNSQLPSDKPNTSLSSASSSSNIQSHPHHQKIDYREYREKKERERLEREKQQQQHHHHPQQRDAHGGVSSNAIHHSKGGPISSKCPPGAQSRSSSSSSSHKPTYQQQQSHMQQSGHFQNTKEHGDISGQNFHVSRESKDNNYLKQHPPHSERDNNKDSNYHGQYPQSSGVQHLNYTHKPDSGYSHRDGSRTNLGSQISGSSGSSQSHHGQGHGSSNQNLLGNQREFGAISQRESAIAKDNTDGQSQPQKKDMSSSIRDIIGQTLPQTDSHSMTNERKDVRDKNRVNYMYGNMTLPNSRPEIPKNGREQNKIFHDSVDKKVDDYMQRSKERVFKKEEEEPVIDTKKVEPIMPVKSEKYEESDSMENFGNSSSGGVNNWNYEFGFNMSSVKSEKKDLLASVKMDSVKTELGIEKSDPLKSDMFSGGAEVNASKSQAVHPVRGIYDSKYKGHHYQSGNKNSDLSQFNNDKQSAQCASDLSKKFNDRLHDKARKIEPDRISHAPDTGPVSDLTKHHKLSKEMQEKHKVLMPGQQHIDQKLKERSSPSKYAKLKTVPRNLEFLKSDSGHFSLDSTVNNTSIEGDRNDKNPSSLKLNDESGKGIGTVNSYHKQQKSHDYGGLTSSHPDPNLMKTSKTSSIFSPDSKIPPQNILSSLEKDVKKSSSMPPRNQSSKASPTSAPIMKTNVPAPVAINTTMSSTLSTGSLFSPPLPKPSQTTVPRHRSGSTGPDAELKMEETPNYENILREKKAALSSAEKSQERDKSMASESGSASIFDFELKTSSKDKSGEGKTSLGRSDSSQFGAGKLGTSAKMASEIRSDLGAVIYPNNPKPVPVSKAGQTFSLTEPKLSLVNSISTVNLSGIEKMVDTSISPAKQTNPYGASSGLKPNLGMNINFNLPVSSGSNTFASIASGQGMELSTDQNTSKSNTMLVNQEIIDVEEISHSEGKKKSEKKKKKEKHKHKDKDKDRSERKKEKKKHKEKDKERVKEKDKHRDKERSKDKDKHREKEIDVVNSEINSEAPIKITIPKDRISGGLKIKIPKDCLKREVESVSPKLGSSGELKIKISKDKFSNVAAYKDDTKSSKKRERSPTSSDLSYSKLPKIDKKISSSSRSNGTDGSSRNSSSHRHSVSENGSYIDISSLYDFPFDFEENGEGIIKTPDYDFEALNSSELREEEFFKNSQNGSNPDSPPSIPKTLDTSPKVDCGGSLPNDLPITVTCREDIPEALEKSIPKDSPVLNHTRNSSPGERGHNINGGEPVPEDKHEPFREEPVTVDDCDVLKNYKSILDSHSKRCELQSRSADDETQECSSAMSDFAGKCVRQTSDTSVETENPHYYNKYFKKDGNVRTRLKDERKGGKGAGEERTRFYDSRYRGEFADRRDDRRFYRDVREYSTTDSQYHFEGNDRRFDYQKYLPNHFYKVENEVVPLNYDINANENAAVYSQSKGAPQFMCESSISSAPMDLTFQYQYGYFNNYMYNNSGFRFFGSMPYMNMSLIQQQPTPPGTCDTSAHFGPPPLPLEPPPDLPPPPETPPPKHS